VANSHTNQTSSEEAKSEVTPKFKDTMITLQNKGAYQSFEQAHSQHVLHGAVIESNHRPKLALEEIKEEEQPLSRVNQAIYNKQGGMIEEEVKDQMSLTTPQK